ncbi:hypothetical protein Sste5346_006102 [Sporothrix stenoceras]|uniref:Aminoglycoside phosphotransferase domain-containing protein n=1 Tax=Sporothrix stenoceras TaxID=5173 RepID=A0ABR3Z000_9PEZI
MAPPKNHELKREKDCFAVTPERKYYRSGDTFIKRNLRPGEWQQHNGYMHVPIFNFERILNEGACLQFVAEHTNVPVPKLLACFEDDGAAYLVTEYVEGVGMDELSAEDQRTVAAELEQHLATLQALTSDTWGGPDGLVLPPYRVMRHCDRRPYRLRPRETADLVFCHNDLQAANVIVNPSTLKINAIIDWEYAGFYPPEFEKPFYQRPGPSVALDGEENDEAALQALLDAAKED